VSQRPTLCPRLIVDGYLVAGDSLLLQTQKPSPPFPVPISSNTRERNLPEASVQLELPFALVVEEGSI